MRRLVLAVLATALAVASCSGPQDSVDSTSVVETTEVSAPSTSSTQSVAGSSTFQAIAPQQASWEWTAYESEYFPVRFDVPATLKNREADLGSESFSGEGRRLEVHLVGVAPDYPVDRWAQHAAFNLAEAQYSGISSAWGTLDGDDAVVVTANNGDDYVRTIHSVRGLVAVTINWFGLDSEADHDAFDRIVDSFELDTPPPVPIDYSYGTLLTDPATAFASFGFEYTMEMNAEFGMIVGRTNGERYGDTLACIQAYEFGEDGVGEEIVEFSVDGSTATITDYMGTRTVHIDSPDVFYVERGCPAASLFWSVNPLLVDDPDKHFVGKDTYEARIANRYAVDDSDETGEWLVDAETGVLLAMEYTMWGGGEYAPAGFGEIAALIGEITDATISYRLTAFEQP